MLLFNQYKFVLYVSAWGGIHPKRIIISTGGGCVFLLCFVCVCVVWCGVCAFNSGNLPSYSYFFAVSFTSLELARSSFGFSHLIHFAILELISRHKKSMVKGEDLEFEIILFNNR